jgi:hypothetical protein
VAADAPNYAHWYRFWLFWFSTDAAARATVDKSLPHQSTKERGERGLDAAGDVSAGATESAGLAGEGDAGTSAVVEAMVLIPIQGDDAKRENAAGHGGNHEITATGVVTKDGPIRADVSSTGRFQASKFLTPMT